MKKIKVAAVSYLNTKPLLYGIMRSEIIEKIELTEAYPSAIAKQLIDQTVDLALIPVAIIPLLNNPHIVTNYCIGANNAVASVCLFSEVAIEQITHVYLDYQSRTSIQLAKILLKEYWKKEVVFIPAKADYETEIKGTVAGIVIGDRAFKQRLKSTFIYDLAEAWKIHTGLSFVFAAWVANTTLHQDFLVEFNNANAYGVRHIEEVIAENNYPLYNLNTYYTKNISYNLDQEKREGMALFLAKLNNL